MILGKITGKITTKDFRFRIENTKAAKNFEFVQVFHPEHEYVLCQIVEVEKTRDETIALCSVLGFKDDHGVFRQLRTPLEPESEVLIASEEFVKEIISLDTEEKAFIGTLEGKEKIHVNLDLKKLLTKHISILAKTGAGKSYVSGVLMEEILDQEVPLLIIDPHGEYASLREKNPNEKEQKHLEQLGLIPKGYGSRIVEYGDINVLEKVKPLLLNEEMTPKELLTLLPAKMTSAQQAVLYAVMKDVKTFTLSQILTELEALDSPHKYQIMSMIDYLRSLHLFSLDYTPYSTLISPGKCSIINLKGIDPEVGEIIVYKLLKDLFEMRKTNKVAPFFCVLEEAHNFIPEKMGGEKKCAGIIRTIAAEGRKFGLGLCVITQRPARIEKNVLSQCNTQIILKVTNPNDLKAISSSVEGITSESEKEIQNLPIGSALITGLSDMPFFVRIRARKTKHGGETVNILKKPDIDILEETKKYENEEMLPVIDSKYSIKEIKLMHEEEKDIETYLIPAVLLRVEGDTSFSLLVDLIKGHVIANIAKKEIIDPEDVSRYSDYATYEQIEYKRIYYDKKLEAKVSASTVIKKLSLHLNIVDQQECFVVYHYAV